jgi:hypothetical protein
MKLRYLGGLPDIKGPKKVKVERWSGGLQIERGGMWNRWLKLRYEDISITYVPDIGKVETGSQIRTGLFAGAAIATGGLLWAGAAIGSHILGKKKVAGILMSARLENGATVGIMFEAPKGEKTYRKFSKMLK